MAERIPSWLELARSDELERRAERLSARLAACDLCPRDCGIDRRVRAGACGVGLRARLSVAVVHRGEEPVISGTRGSGGLFLGGCNLRCTFCQNHQISQPPDAAAADESAPEQSTSELADAMLSLQARGCHNLNLVSASHVVPQVLAALSVAAKRGLRLPIVWNSNGYERVDVLRELDGVVDVYLPDIKYSAEGMGRRFSRAPGYPAANRAALLEMHRQVGDLVLDDDGVAQRGLIIRHLVLPRNVAGSAASLRFVAEHLGPGVAVSLMAQYAPAHEACDDRFIGRRLLPEEYERAVEALTDAGVELGWLQDLEESPNHYRPDFDRERPFEEGEARCNTER